MKPTKPKAPFHRFQAFIQEHFPDSEAVPDYVPDDFILLFDGHLERWEAAVLGLMVTSALWRGASSDDCVRFTETGEVPLPFQGCELQIFNLLLGEIRRRSDDPDMAVRMVRALADLQTHLLAMILGDQDRRSPANGSSPDCTIN